MTPPRCSRCSRRWVSKTSTSSGIGYCEECEDETWERWSTCTDAPGFDFGPSPFLRPFLISFELVGKLFLKGMV